MRKVSNPKKRGVNKKNDIEYQLNNLKALYVALENKVNILELSICNTTQKNCRHEWFEEHDWDGDGHTYTGYLQRKMRCKKCLAVRYID